MKCGANHIWWQINSTDLILIERICSMSLLIYPEYFETIVIQNIIHHLLNIQFHVRGNIYQPLPWCSIFH